MELGQNYGYQMHSASGYGDFQQDFRGIYGFGEKLLKLGDEKKLGFFR